MTPSSTGRGVGRCYSSLYAADPGALADPWTRRAPEPTDASLDASRAA